MTVSDLIAKLSSYPADARVTLLYPDKQWLLPIEITHLSADGSNREVDFIAITADGRRARLWRLDRRRFSGREPHDAVDPQGGRRPIENPGAGDQNQQNKEARQKAARGKT
jgi:hypothetical protein